MTLTPAEIETLKQEIKDVQEAFQEASSHLDYTGYGDKWERECAEHANLPEKVSNGLALLASAVAKIERL
jgi:hypothetical protein